MSLRDDLRTAINFPQTHEEAVERQEACDRLRAALTPAAEKWLEALPELMGMQADFRVTRGPYYARGSYLTVRDNISRSIEHVDELGVGPSGRFQAVPFAHMEDAELLAALRNALHEAAALQNAQDNKEQK